jgi:hypothetical protein
MTVYPDSPQKNTCELGSTTISFDDLQKSLEAARDTVDNVTNRSGIIVGSRVYLPDGYTEMGEKITVSVVEKFESVDEATETAQQSAIAAQMSANSAADAAEEAWQHADSAKEAAEVAWDHADEALEAAGVARDAAYRAQDSADAAMDSATQANTHANSALTQLGVVEQVLDVLNYIVAHGTYTKTADTAVDPNKSYFVLQNDAFALVQDPREAYLSTYYELSFDETLRNFVASHLALTDAGLYVLKDSSGYKVLVANDKLQIQDPTGRAVITYGESIVPDSSRPFYIGNARTYIKWYDKDGDGIPDSIAIAADSITFGGSGETVEDRLDSIYDWEPEIRYASTPGGSSGTMTDARICKAHVFINGQEVTSQIPDDFFSWYWCRESTSGETLIGTGKQLEVDGAGVGYNGVIYGDFYPERDDIILIDDDGVILTDDDGYELEVTVAAL